jgi:hypothetical protein
VTLALTLCLTWVHLAADLVIDSTTLRSTATSANNVYIGNVSGTLNQIGGTNTENNNLYLGFVRRQRMPIT